jgi:hypothetical protein
MTEDRVSVIGQKAYELLTPDKQDLYVHRATLADWVGTACAQWEFNGVETLMILPAATDTKHWHKYIFATAAAICFIRGRVRFLLPNGEPGGPAPMACALVYWGHDRERFRAAFEKKGHIVYLDGFMVDAKVCPHCYAVDCDVCHMHDEPLGDCSGCGEAVVAVQ